MQENRHAAKVCPEKVGILTFHCSDNFGAMLQAYGLLTRLRKEGFDAFIVNYAPAFLTGRDWFLPYFPAKSPGRRLDVFLWGLKRNLLAGRTWRARRRLMAGFRTAHLTGKDRPIRSIRGLARVKADLLIVGSDQIWNPALTFGLRAAYFGAFQNSRVRKTVAYAASFGADTLPKGAEPEFEKLLASVHRVSMREKAAAEYVSARFGRKAVHVVDPVFLLSGEEWRAVAKHPQGDLEKGGFLFYYETEPCEPLRQAAARLSREKGLAVIALSANENRWGRWPFCGVWAAGPAEFLGWLSAAEYVFTNSFHGLAFSILLHKPFYICNHGTVGARIKSLLETTGLTGRMAAGGYAPDIDGPINWTEVETLLQAHRQQSVEFLLQSLRV